MITKKLVVFRHIVRGIRSRRRNTTRTRPNQTSNQKDVTVSQLMTEPDSSPTSRLVAEVLGLKKPKNNKRFVGGAKFQKIEKAYDRLVMFM